MSCSQICSRQFSKSMPGSISGSAGGFAFAALTGVFAGGAADLAPGAGARKAAGAADFAANCSSALSTSLRKFSSFSKVSLTVRSV